VSLLFDKCNAYLKSM